MEGKFTCIRKRVRFFHFPFGLCVLWEDIQIILKAVMFLFSEGIVDHRQRCLSRVPLEVLLHPLQENAISGCSQPGLQGRGSFTDSAEAGGNCCHILPSQMLCPPLPCLTPSASSSGRGLMEGALEMPR